ncbi:hypothetical protein [Pseudoduganella lutea]|uniref:Uncharacterized protein n=1 Tax=Pseudoduganella lutea TaxID=321985 RepID=A0A4P6L4I7_9BURK|nr:hypothetical protein [Pseudoduganella lutea]QBE66344.1 hypothetical protein EWM63_28005 [Pseudoduganella lutea]
MKIRSRTGLIMTPEQFDELWKQFEANAKLVDPDAFHVEGGEERFTASMDGLKGLLRDVIVRRKTKP